MRHIAPHHRGVTNRSRWNRIQRQAGRRVKKGYKKYRNREISFDGKIFDSRAEMRFYIGLRDQVRKKEILEFEHQPKIELFQDPINKGRTVVYKPDFRVVRNDDTEFFVEVKSPQTAKEAAYRLRIKCVKHFHPDVELHECIYTGKGMVSEKIY